MNDRALLELAAKATGHRWKWTTCPRHGDQEVPGMHHRDSVNEVDYFFGWNPLADSANAFDLAVKLGLEVYHTLNDNEWTAFVGYPKDGRITFVYEAYGADPLAATRRAIVRAAAEIGKATPL